MFLQEYVVTTRNWDHKRIQPVATIQQRYIQTSRQTDSQTNERTSYSRNTALYTTCVKPMR